MKNLAIIAFLFLSPICFSQQVEIATAISPEDLGAYKWIFSGTAQENYVVIFRITTVREWPNGKLISTKIYDSVRYGPGKKQTGTAFFIDPHTFEPKGEEPKWCFSALGGTGWIEGRYAGHSYGDNKGEINFKGENFNTKKVFETFIKSYDEAVALYGDLPPITPNGGWGWAGSPKEQSEQAGSGQPAIRPESKSEGSDKTKP